MGMLNNMESTGKIQRFKFIKFLENMQPPPPLFKDIFRIYIYNHVTKMYTGLIPIMRHMCINSFPNDNF